MSEYSSGPVAPDEVLVRILVAPQHMPNKGRPRASALSDAEWNGLSVFREQQVSDRQLRTVAEGLVERARASSNEKAGVFGVLRMLCSTIRTRKTEGENDPAYCVYDTALEDNPSHAEAFQRVAGVEKAICDHRRATLFVAVKTDFVPVADFRRGLLADLAPNDQKF